MTSKSSSSKIGGKKVATQTSAIQLVQSSRFAQWVARWLVIVMIISILGMATLPWQQTSRGTGQVVAYAPQERQQTVQSRIKGVVAKVTPGLVEGSIVKKGDIILEIEQVAFDMKAQLEGQLKNLDMKIDATIAKADAYQLQVDAYTNAKVFAVQAADEMVKSAEAKLKSKREQIRGYEFKEKQAQQQYDRQLFLFNSDAKPEKEVEKWLKDLEVAKADLASLRQDIISLTNELTAKQKEREEKKLLAQTKIDYAIAMKAGAISETETIRKDKIDVQMKLDALNRGGKVKAPRDGTIFRMPIFEQGQTVKEGEPLFTIIPDSAKKAVELLVPGNDMPLIKMGDEVRLQFEGWPAVQFVGWPSVSVGTFSGVVSTVDATDNGKGKFRILVVQNPKADPWPSDQFLRQGVRANGWVMLRQVSLGYEVWRQLNGFPVIVSDSEPKQKKAKKPKLPKRSK